MTQPPERGVAREICYANHFHPAAVRRVVKNRRARNHFHRQFDRLLASEGAPDLVDHVLRSKADVFDGEPQHQPPGLDQGVLSSAIPLERSSTDVPFATVYFHEDPLGRPRKVQAGDQIPKIDGELGKRRGQPGLVEQHRLLEGENGGQVDSGAGSNRDRNDADDGDFVASKACPVGGCPGFERRAAG